MVERRHEQDVDAESEIHGLEGNGVVGEVELAASDIWEVGAALAGGFDAGGGEVAGFDVGEVLGESGSETAHAAAEVCGSFVGGVFACG